MVLFRIYAVILAIQRPKSIPDTYVPLGRAYRGVSRSTANAARADCELYADWIRDLIGRAPLVAAHPKG